jgi:phosphoglycerate dehydrogenase-like enzyme
MSTKIFISARLLPEWVDKLRAYGDVDFYDWGKEGHMLAPEALSERMADADVFVVESDKVTRPMIERATHLKHIVVCRGTIITVDLDACAERGILVTHTPGRNADSVADLTVCFMLMISRHVTEAMQGMKQGEWVRLGKADTYLKYQGFELFGRIAGLVGLGAIGRRVVQRLKSFNMKVIAYDPFIAPEEAQQLGVGLVSLDDLMRQSDYVSLHAAATPETKDMVGAQELALMKPGAYLINTARAQLVNEAALLDALNDHRIAGAAVDVYMEEPLPLESPWYHVSNAICTPHIGGASNDVILHQSEMAITSVVDFLEGRQPDFVAVPGRKQVA